MNEFIDFLLKNWALTALFFCLLISVFVYEARNQGFGSKIDAASLVQKMNNDATKIYDIRSATAFQSGHISGSKMIAEDKIKSDMSNLVSEDKVTVLVCDNGQKSGALVGQLKKQMKGRDIVLLSGGVSEWKRQNLPLKKGKK